MKHTDKQLNFTRLLKVGLVAGVGLLVVMLLKNEAHRYWQTRLTLDERTLFTQAVDTCLQAGSVSWSKDGITTQIPHQATFEMCLAKKGY